MAALQLPPPPPIPLLLFLFSHFSSLSVSLGIGVLIRPVSDLMQLPDMLIPERAGQTAHRPCRSFHLAPFRSTQMSWKAGNTTDTCTLGRYVVSINQ